MSAKAYKKIQTGVSTSKKLIENYFNPPLAQLVIMSFSDESRIARPFSAASFHFLWHSVGLFQLPPNEVLTSSN